MVAKVNTAKAFVNSGQAVAHSLECLTHNLLEYCVSMGLIRVGWSLWIIIAQIAIRQRHPCNSWRVRRSWRIYRMRQSGSRFSHLLALGWLKMFHKLKRVIMRLSVMILAKKLLWIHLIVYKWFTRNSIWMIRKMSYHLMLYCHNFNNRSKRTIFSHRWLLLKLLKLTSFTAKR